MGVGGECSSLHDLTLGSNSGLAITGQSGTPAGTPDSLAGFLPPGLKKLLMQVRTYWSVTQPAPRRGPRKRQVQTFLTLKIRAPSWKATPARALGRSLSPRAGTRPSVLTNREELSFFTVLAFPKASRMGLACSSCRSSSPWKEPRCCEGQAEARAAKPALPDARDSGRAVSTHAAHLE